MTPDATPDVAPAQDLGPRPLSLFALLLRSLGGLGGGMIGTGVIFGISLVGAGILQSALGSTGDGTINPLFVFVFMAMIFLGSVTSNLLGPLFMGLSDHERYKRLATSLYQIFIANVVTLIVMAPIYVVVAGLNVSMIASVAALQVIVSAFTSALILEIIADYRYALLAIYSTAFSVMVSAGVYFLFYSISSGQPIFLLFLALPVMWISIGLFGGLIQLLYGFIYKLYGVDFLSSVTVYGADERWVSEEEETQVELKKEELRTDTGASFLQKSEKQ